MNLKEPGGAHAAADAHGDDRALGLAPAPFDQNVAHHARAAHAVGVADRDGAAVDVELVLRNAEAVTSTWLANASLSSHRSMSSMASPCCLSSLGTANTGPMPISSGSQPATASARNAPSGVSPRCSASFASMITQAEAPSESWLALPAVMKPPSRTGWSDESPSRVVSGRLPSSLLSVTGSKLSAFVFLSTTFLIDGSGAISWVKRPACCAAAVRRWLSSA